MATDAQITSVRNSYGGILTTDIMSDAVLGALIDDEGTIAEAIREAGLRASLLTEPPLSFYFRDRALATAHDRVQVMAGGIVSYGAGTSGADSVELSLEGNELTVEVDGASDSVDLPSGSGVEDVDLSISGRVLTLTVDGQTDNVTIPETVLGDGDVTEAKIADGAVTEDKLGDDAVTSDKIGDGEVGEAQLANDAVTNQKIDTAAVNSSEIAQDAVGNYHLAPNAVQLSQLDSSVYADEEDVATGTNSTKLVTPYLLDNHADFDPKPSTEWSGYSYETTLNWVANPPNAGEVQYVSTDPHVLVKPLAADTDMDEHLKVGASFRVEQSSSRHVEGTISRTERILSNGAFAYFIVFLNGATLTGSFSDESSVKLVTESQQARAISDAIDAAVMDTDNIADDAITQPKLADNSVGNAQMRDDSVGLNELSATGTASATTYLRGDNSWASVAAGNATFPTTQLSDVPNATDEIWVNDGASKALDFAYLTTQRALEHGTRLADKTKKGTISAITAEEFDRVDSGGVKRFLITNGSQDEAAIDFIAAGNIILISSSDLSVFECGTVTGTVSRSLDTQVNFTQIVSKGTFSNDTAYQVRVILTSELSDIAYGKQVSTADVADDAITNAKLANNATGTAQIANRAVTKGKLAWQTKLANSRTTDFSGTTETRVCNLTLAPSGGIYPATYLLSVTAVGRRQTASDYCFVRLKRDSDGDNTNSGTTLVESAAGDGLSGTNKGWSTAFQYTYTLTASTDNHYIKVTADNHGTSSNDKLQRATLTAEQIP